MSDRVFVHAEPVSKLAEFFGCSVSLMYLLARDDLFPAPRYDLTMPLYDVLEVNTFLLQRSGYRSLGKPHLV